MGGLIVLFTVTPNISSLHQYRIVTDGSAKMEWDHEMTWFAGLASLGLVLALLEIIRLIYTGIKKKEKDEQAKTLEV